MDQYILDEISEIKDIVKKEQEESDSFREEVRENVHKIDLKINTLEHKLEQQDAHVEIREAEQKAQRERIAWIIGIIAAIASGAAPFLLK